MSSKLERTLQYDGVTAGNICKSLSGYLDDGVSLYRMRAASQQLRHAVDLGAERLWGVLHMHGPIRRTDKVFTLDCISLYCHTLTIKVQIPDRSTTNRPKGRWHPRTLVKGNGQAPHHTRSTGEIMWPQNLGAYEVDRQLWTHIFKKFKNLENLTLCVAGDPGWPGRGEVEHTLTTLRCALERAELCNIRSFLLSPVHICGILHLNWHGFGALYEVASPQNCADLWQSVTLLDIRLSSPMCTKLLTVAQTAMSIKILQSCLRSFAPTLRRLRFVWLNGDGPSPLLLDNEPGMENMQRLFWPRLDELWFGNTTSANKTIQVVPDRAPNVKVVKVLRSSHRFSRLEAENGEAWIDIDVEMSMARRRQEIDSATSSFYSQDGT